MKHWLATTAADDRLVNRLWGLLGTWLSCTLAYVSMLCLHRGWSTCMALPECRLAASQQPQPLVSHMLPSSCTHSSAHLFL